MLQWRFQIKVNDFFNFFSMINFSYQYLPEPKAYLEPTRTFDNGAKYCFCKIHKKAPVLKPHFRKVTGLYSATSLKKRTPTQMFSGEFYEILKTTFLQNTSRRLLLFYGKKYFINIIVKNPLRKGKKWKQLVRKTTTQAKQKLHHYSHQVFIFFYYSKMLLFLFSLLPMIWWKHEFLETMQYHWGLSTIENDFSPSVWKIVFYLYDCNNSINPIQDGLFWGCSRMGGPFCPPPYLKSATHILQWWNLAQLYLT